MKYRSFKNILLLSSLTLMLTSCGGGGGGGEVTLKSTINAGSVDYYHYAWNLNPSVDSNFQTTNNIDSNAGINLGNSWTITKGLDLTNSPVKVAVIDEDFDIEHPDIKDRIASTYNAMDDTTVVSNTRTEDYSHGTAVAGFIASKYLGIAPEVELILINIGLSDTNNATDVETIKAFDYAKNQGAKIINCSWGSAFISQALTDKIQELKDAGITVVFASGNDGQDLTGGLTQEAELSTVLSVGASSVLNDVTSYSNYGDTLDVLAPGGGSFNDNLLGVLGLDVSGAPGENDGTESIKGNSLVTNNYSFTSGTSFAAPTTSGLLALMYAVNPNLTLDSARTILIETANKIGSGTYSDIVGDNTTSTFNNQRGYGKINANAALLRAQAEYVP